MPISIYEIEILLTSDDTAKVKEAREKCLILLKSKPADLSYLYLMSRIEFQLGHADLSSKWIKKILAIKHDSPDLYCLYAEMLAMQNKHSIAITAFKQSITLRPKFAKAYYGCLIHRLIHQVRVMRLPRSKFPHIIKALVISRTLQRQPKIQLRFLMLREFYRRMPNIQFLMGKPKLFRISRKKSMRATSLLKPRTIGICKR